ncbi:uncharacterized protein [Amphiura filiformis]|uniref:uncharacterized protein n=1 Tax=Amphiura filiformis TaxID=82378 RepID=UPI003B20D57D
MDCSDYSDELPINTNCPACGLSLQNPEFSCNNGECIHEFYKCNRYMECSDYSDELPINTDCPPCDELDGEFTCDNGECIIPKYPHLGLGACDFAYDCMDRSDEMQPNNSECDCGCTEADRCDGTMECRDNITHVASDEFYCEGSFLDTFTAYASSPTDLSVNWVSTCLGLEVGRCYAIDIKVEVFLTNQDGCLPIDGIGTKVAQLIEPALCIVNDIYDYYDYYYDYYYYTTILLLLLLLLIQWDTIYSPTAQYIQYQT